MTTVSVVSMIGNAAAVLCGPWGAVTAHAQQVGCSRQTAYEHAHRVHQAVTDWHGAGPSRDQLVRQRDALLQENQQLWDAWSDSVPFDSARQRRFAATAAALGLSLHQTRTLLLCILSPAHCPSRATLDRWIDAAAARASQLVRLLDTASQPLIRELCLDEIFCHRLPILMGVDPHSLAWVLGQRGPDRSGPTWQQALRPWSCLEYVAADNGTGMQRGLDGIRQERSEAGHGPDLEVSLDVFHTQREGRTALRREWAAAEEVWEQAEKADRELAQIKRRGQDRRAATQRALRAWERAEAAFQVAQRREAAWLRIEQTLNLFRPDGQLNERHWAEAQLEAAVPNLDGPRWAKVRRMVSDPRSRTFLDRLHRDLEAAEPRPQLRAALVALWRVRHATRPGCGPRPRGAVEVVAPVVRALACGQLEPDWHGAYRRVARVLHRVVRASSVVECLNSVVRMHQARHRTLNQPLLDLKRLYWNCRVFAEGKHKGKCPYEHLGLQLPTYDWWELLHQEPQQVEQKVSTRSTAA
jgi:hypothetical protein